MNAGLLRIERMTATVHPGAGLGPAGAERVAALHRRTAQIELEQAWHDEDLPPGLWLLDRVDVQLSLPGTVPDAEFAGRWARTIADAIRTAMSRDDAGVVHYPTLLDAVADAVSGEALGRRERAWAWRRLGLVPAGGAARPAVPGLLRLHPELALAALLAAVQRCGIAALDRALGGAGWTSVAEVVWRAAGGPELPAESHDAAPAEVGGSGFARALAASRLSPGATTRRAWAVLVAVELDPLLPGRPDGLGRLAGVRHALDDVLGGRNHSPSRTGREPAGTAPTDTATVPAPADGAAVAVAADAAGRRAADDAGQSGADAGQSGGDEAGRRAGSGRMGAGFVTDPAGGPAAPALPGKRVHRATPGRLGAPEDEGSAIVHPRPGDGIDGWTAYAGLPFLLATAVPAGVPDRLAETTLAGRPPAWCLATLGRLICAAEPDDPGLMALAGSHREAWPAIRTAPPADPAEAEALATIAADWIQVTAARLAPDPPPTAAAGADLVGRMVRRPGRVLARPGWVEVELSADRVDLSVRRAGLDLDPGIVPWLGVVVGYRYV